MSNSTYDILKKVALLAVPLATFLTTIGDIWGLPVMIPIAATVSAFGVFLGGVLVKSSADYIPEDEEDGDEVFETTDAREDIEERIDE